MVILVMGVSGSGKTTIGRAVAERLQAVFVDADDYHPAANIEKMRAGIALSDEDRQPWLDALCAELAAQGQARRPVVLACSALSKMSRARLRRAAPEMKVVWLHGPRGKIADRMRSREHFMPEKLLASQFEALEPPENALELSIELSPEELARIICSHVAGERSLARESDAAAIPDD
jgi:gluconokinase